MIHSFAPDFRSQIKRIELRGITERFFGSTDVPFVAIDGSCHKHTSAEFVSFYGGAYGSKGNISFSGPEAKISYRRWELTKDVSMVAFVPIPPERADDAIDRDEAVEADGGAPLSITDQELGEISSIHTKVMQLAEVYLAYSMATGSTIESPKLMLIDGTISGMLGNTSFAPRDRVKITDGLFGDILLDMADLYMALAHPISEYLDVPSPKMFQPHNRIVAEAIWSGGKEVKLTSTKLKKSSFISGARTLERETIGAGSFNEASGTFTFYRDPSVSWRRCISVFEHVCRGLFVEKSKDGLSYRTQEGRRRYLLPRDIVFLTGVGLRALIEECWRRKILLVGVTKDSNSRYFARNMVGSVSVLRGEDPSSYLNIGLTDRRILELLPNLVTGLEAPWSTLDFDSCFMTLHPEEDNSGQWVVRGYNTAMAGEVTRPERIFLRSIAQFMLIPGRSLASHAVLIDRLAYPGWDDVDSASLDIDSPKFGIIRPLTYNGDTGVPRLQSLVMYLLTVLARNHFPEALGYPEPLHKADWGAKSMRDRVKGILSSSEWSFRSKPLHKLMREIRDSFGR
jgi:hypothetical protein